MDKARTLMEITSPEAGEIIAATRLAIIPLGSVEQHGGHLPLGTDYYAAEAFARRVAALTGGLLADFCPYGVTPLHMGFPGTVTLRSETFLALLLDVVGSLHRHGVRRFVYLNWHERNAPAVEIAAERAQNEYEDASVLIVNAHFVAKNLYGQKVGLTHGGELEVLPILADHPELAHLEKATDASPMERGVQSDRFRRDPAIYYVPKDVRDMYHTGWYGVIEDTSPGRVEAVMEGVSRAAAERIRGFFGM